MILMNLLILYNALCNSRYPPMEKCTQNARMKMLKYFFIQHNFDANSKLL